MSIGIVDGRYGVVANRVTAAVDPGDQDKPAGNALSLSGHPVLFLRSSS
jgi:hypothetical protein